jgi:hypothetical protein
LKRKRSDNAGRIAAGFDYVPLLRQWSRELIASELGTRLGINTTQPEWLGSAPAAPEAIAGTEARLGVALPPSYRQFLLTSDGWGPLSAFVHRLRPCSEIDWYIVENANAVEVWGQGDDDEGLSDTEYFRYADDSPWFRCAHLRHTLQISDHGDGDLLLNPRAVTPDGEWECWFLAAWIPGVRRYASFAHWLLSEYRSFRRLEGIGGAEPLLPEFAVPAPEVKRKAVKPKRPKLAARPLEELMDAMASSDAGVRSKAAKEFAGRLESRAQAERRPELIEPLTRMFRTSPHADVRNLCVQMITQVAPNGSTPAAILEAFSDPDARVVLAGIWAHHNFDVRPAFDALCRFVDTTDNPIVKDSAVLALREIADPRAIPVLLRVLHDRHQTFDQLFGTAAYALAAYGTEAVPHFIAALKDADARVRLAAVVGLAQFDDPSIIEHLRPMLADQDESVRTRAEYAIQSGNHQG